MNPDNLRTNQKAVQFVKAFFEAGVEQSRKMTPYPSLPTGLKNAGARWVDQEVVTGHGLVTSRNPGDLSAFNMKMIKEIREGI